MNLLRRTALSILSFLALSATGADQDAYERFRTELIYSHHFSNEQVNQMVANGIASDDPVIVELTLNAIGTFSHFSNLKSHGLPAVAEMLSSSVYPTRALAEVPGLKDFLIRYWEREFAESDYDPVRAQDRALKAADDALADFDEDTDLEAAMEAFMFTMVSENPEWRYIPAVLSLHWPGDDEVQRVVLDWYEAGTTSDVEIMTTLNAGEFTTREANAARVEALSRAVEHTDGLAEGHIPAARGLAMSGSPEAIPYLISSGHEDWALKALGEYDDAQLIPYAKDMTDFLPESSPRPGIFRTLTEREVLVERLKTLVDRAGIE